MIREIPGALFKYLKLSEGLAYLQRTPVDLNYRETLRGFVKNRETSFLDIARRVLAVAEHPYSQLFDVARCAYADLESGVRRNGLDATLSDLMREGVYLTLDEFRCATEIVRGGRHIRAAMTDWDNARGKGPLQAVSSGSSGGRGIRTHSGLAFANYALLGLNLLGDEFLLHEKSAVVLILPILPGSGIGACLSLGRIGHPPERWYALGGGTQRNWHYKAVTAAIVTRLRLAGAKVPHPIYLEPDDFRPVAEFLAQRKREGVRPALGGMVSSISRVAAAAVDHGIDVRGTFAMVAGESLTDAKRAVIESAGMAVFPCYGASDFGMIGLPCLQMSSGNCVHVASSSIALVPRRIEDPFGDEEVNSLHVTGVLPFAPRVLINVEIGDTGVVEPATCDCEFSRLGYNLQIRDIAAFSKICGQGGTIRATEVLRLLEEGLPARFGGRAGDYQLLEVEGNAQTDMVLRISPRMGVASPEDVLEYFLRECRSLYGGALAVLQWTQSKGMRVEVKEPVLAQTGKFRAIRLLGAGTRTPAAVPNPAAIPDRIGSA